jgi:hypothetical protein
VVLGGEETSTVGGKSFSISREEVERSLKGVQPEPIRQYYVTVNGRDYPVKQAVEVSASLLRSGFTTQDAIRILRKFGFPLRKLVT